MFWVTSPRLEVRLRNSPVDSSGSFPARSSARTWAKNQSQDEGPGGQQHGHDPDLVVRGEDARHDQDETDG